MSPYRINASRPVYPNTASPKPPREPTPIPFMMWTVCVVSVLCASFYVKVEYPERFTTFLMSEALAAAFIAGNINTRRR